MAQYISVAGLNVHPTLYHFVGDELVPRTRITAEHFWSVLHRIVVELGPKNQALLQQRAAYQRQLDEWWRNRRGRRFDVAAFKDYLYRIHYLVPEGPAFQVTTTNVDYQIACVNGPQCVVPLTNARYAANAANAGWVNIWDPLYGFNFIPETAGTEKGTGYNPGRGSKVIEWTDRFFDDVFPLAHGSYCDVIRYGLRQAGDKIELLVTLRGDVQTSLAKPTQFAGYTLGRGQLSSFVLVKHGLHVQFIIDRTHPVGQHHAAGVCAIEVQAAPTTIQDLEDAVSAVDAVDKVLGYRNWLLLNLGDIEATFEKDGRMITRRLNPDRTYIGPEGKEFTLPGRSLLVVRNVGKHRYTDAVTTANGQPIPETFLDCLVTALAAKHDLLRNGKLVNSRAGSIYIVEPKQHGPEEVAATVELFEYVERGLGLEPGTIKMGIMDEEERLSLTLKPSIRAAQARAIFINTGYLDRTAGKFWSCLEAGPVLPDADVKNSPWLKAYEARNVMVGLQCGLHLVGQIGKGMWTMPDLLAEMFAQKIAHPQAGANTAWVPSPNAGAIHALHYLMVDVDAVQRQLAGSPLPELDELLRPPVLNDRVLTPEEIQRQLDNDVQGLLGYTAPWVGQGIGCSKVPNLDNVGLMEDCATARIKRVRQFNWLSHGLISRDQLVETFKRMADMVDRQNAGAAGYRPMGPNLQANEEFRAAMALPLEAHEDPDGYVERILTVHRLKVKAQNALP